MIILFHIRLNLMFLVVSALSMALYYFDRTDFSLLYRTVAVLFAGIFLTEVIYGISKHDELYGEDS